MSCLPSLLCPWILLRCDDHRIVRLLKHGSILRVAKAGLDQLSGHVALGLACDVAEREHSGIRLWWHEALNAVEAGWHKDSRGKDLVELTVSSSVSDRFSFINPKSLLTARMHWYSKGLHSGHEIG